MKSGKTILGGICYRLDVHEGMATFIESNHTSGIRITVIKSGPYELLYVQATSATGFVPYAHIRKAIEISESLFGPNHYPSLAAMHRSERNIAAHHIWRRPIWKPKQRLFWTHEIPFRFMSAWRVIKHQYRLLAPKRAPRIEWAVAFAPVSAGTGKEKIK